MRLSSRFVVSLATLASARPAATVKREGSQLRPSYDFVIVGGGTSGLTVADRLSEAFPKKTVLVVEYGEIEYAPGSFDPPTDPPGNWTFFSLPNPEVNNKSAWVAAGQVLGGSSAINGQFFDRPSRFDHDSWLEAAGREFESNRIKWDWKGIFPYFKKSVTFTEPSPELVEKYNYTWDISAYGGKTPIHSSFPPFQWADLPILGNVWRELGIQKPKECAGGDKEGICWVPTSQHPVTARRSHAGLGHYAAVIDSRKNYDVLLKHQVVRVVYPGKPCKNQAPLVEVRSLADNSLFNVTAKAEVVISAGALHSPTVLLRSGIGPAAVLKEAGIPVVLDLPGVGSNLQDHTGPVVSWTLTKSPDLHPNQTDMADPAFAADALAGYDEVPARGPYTHALGNTAIYVSLPHLDPSYTTTIAKIRAILTSGTAASYLPPDYRSSQAMIAGYEAQLSALATLLSNPQAPSLETPWSGGTSALPFLLHPLSRGTVRLDPADHLAQPILDYRAGSNPIDFDIHLAHVRFLRRAGQTPTMQKYGAVEVVPGPDVADDDDEALLASIREQMTLSFMHPCCTAAMLPEKKGGVVGPDLKVYGAGGRLRVVDISVLPLVPSTHTSSVAYAVGEKAADIIIDEWRGRKD